MELITKESLAQNEEHKKLFSLLGADAASLMELVLEDGPVREDVIKKFTELSINENAIYYETFLRNTQLGGDWYKLIDRIFREHENDYIAYLSPLEDYIQKADGKLGKLKLEEVTKVYEESQTAFQFNRELEDLSKISSVIQNKNTEIAESMERDEKSAGNQEKEIYQEKKSQKREIMSKEISKKQEAKKTRQTMIVEEAEYGRLQEKEEQIFEKFCNASVGDFAHSSDVNIHKLLIDTAMKVKEEFDEIHNRLMEAERIIAMQKAIKDRYAAQVQYLQAENEQKTKNYEELNKQYEEKCRQYASLHKMLCNTLSEHSEIEKING